MTTSPLPRSSLYTRVVAGVLFPLHERFKRHSTVAVRRQLEATQYWSEAQLEALQLERLRALLLRAQRQVPYYRELFARIGFDAERDVHDLSALARLPLLDKPIIRANDAALKAHDARDLSRFSTGGSTGEPLIFHIGKHRVSHDVAAKWRATRWWNVDIGDPEVVLWGSPIELAAQDRVRMLRDRMLRSELLPAFETSADQLDRFLARIRARRPKMLFGYPSVLSLLARHADARGLRMDDLGIRAAFVTSECLYPPQREQIERVFGCGVANGYGGRDAGFIAHQCPAGGMHITAEDIIVEVLGPDGQPVPRGESGEIVVTHLQTGDYPFIRYRTGDVGALDTAACSCGRGLPLLKEIKGRTTDFMILADGTVLHSAALAYVMRDMPEVKAFKIIQETIELTRLQVVLGQPLDEAMRARLVQGFRKRLGPDVRIEVEQVEAIEPEKSGKYRYLVSKLDLVSHIETQGRAVEQA